MKPSPGPSSLNSEPVLAPPGAGLPWAQHLLLKYWVYPFIAQRTTWQRSEENFYKVHQLIQKELIGLTDLQMQKRCLVPPQLGLEDSSRYWSILMTLEHLLIVGRGIFQVVSALTAGRIPDGKADTATVKPAAQFYDRNIVLEFNRFVEEDFKQFNKTIQNRQSSLTFQHPWFGMMKAQSWYWLLATHGMIHLKQIRAIKKCL